MFIKPYSDKLMKYDETTHRYTLTKDYVLRVVPEIMSQLKDEGAILMALEQVSDDIYDYMHEYTFRDSVQDFIIAHTETGRRVIQKAMEKQLIYLIAVGDTTFYLDDNKRKMYIAEKSKKVLMTNIPEIGTTIIYSGDMSWIRLPEGW